MTLYELNQINYPNLPTMTEEQIQKKIPYIVSFLDEHKGRYYLLLETDQRYYTFFTFNKNHYNPGEMARELISLVQNLGEIKSIETDTLNNMLEFWVMKDEECRMYGFFNYDIGVIEIS